MRWNPRPIAELVEPCQTWNPAEAEGSFAYIDLSSVDKDSKAITQIERLPCADAPSRARQLIACGDVLVATVRPNLNGVALVDDLHDGMTASTGYCVLRPRNESLASKYLFHWVMSPRFVDAMIKVATGANYPAVSDAKVKDSLIPLPPLPVQKKIAAILDAAHALRAKRRESIEQLDSLVQATFLEMFGDPVTNPKGWPSQTVDRLVRLVRGSSPRPKGDSRFYGGPIPRLMVADITRDGFRVTPMIDSLTVEGAGQSRPVPAGTVVMAVSGDVGVVATVAVDCCVHDGFVAFLDLDESVVQSFFLMLQLHLLKVTHERRKAGAIFQNLTTTDVKSMGIMAPPLDLQIRFATIVESIEQQKARMKAHLAELDTLFASLQSRAFNGELVA